jgi:hypothetical protein
MGMIDQSMTPPADARPPAARPMNAEDVPTEQAEQLDESNPAYQRATDMVKKALYEDGAAEDLARALTTAEDPIEEIANAAYEIVSMIDEKTGGELPDELLVSFAVDVMTEVAEVAQAAGIQIGGAQAAQAMKTMVQRYAAESGADTSQIEAALGQVDVNELGAALEGAAGGAK